MTTHENIVEAIMLNGWTREEAEAIKGEYLKRKIIKVDKHNGGWEYTSGVFADKETQALALDIVKNPVKGDIK